LSLTSTITGLIQNICCYFGYKSAFSTLTLLVGHQEEHPDGKKFEWCGAGMVICLKCNLLLY